jgi:hypothetical protein
MTGLNVAGSASSAFLTIPIVARMDLGVLVQTEVTVAMMILVVLGRHSVAQKLG